jgi:hypothetical protein
MKEYRVVIEYTNDRGVLKTMRLTILANSIEEATTIAEREVESLYRQTGIVHYIKTIKDE